jgi:hypothetical protein
MKLFLVLAIAAIASFSLSAADVAGSWKGSVDTQMGAMDVTITFQPGATLAGKVKAGGYEGTIEKAHMDGDNISFEANIDPGKLVFGGTVGGDEMKLNMTGTQGTQYSLVCKRQK